MDAALVVVVGTLVAGHGGLTWPPPRNNYHNINPANWVRAVCVLSACVVCVCVCVCVCDQCVLGSLPMAHYGCSRLRFMRWNARWLGGEMQPTHVADLSGVSRSQNGGTCKLESNAEHSKSRTRAALIVNRPWTGCRMHPSVHALIQNTPFTWLFVHRSLWHALIIADMESHPFACSTTA
jgi:hypothetical protein